MADRPWNSSQPPSSQSSDASYGSQDRRSMSSSQKIKEIGRQIEESEANTSRLKQLQREEIIKDALSKMK